MQRGTFGATLSLAIAIGFADAAAPVGDRSPGDGASISGRVLDRAGSREVRLKLE